MQIYWRLKSVPELKGLNALQRNELYLLVSKKERLTRFVWFVVFFSMLSVSPAANIFIFHFRKTLPPPFSWILLVAEAVWILILFPLQIGRARSHMKKILDGCCPVCDYDLRGSSNRCPECGTVIAKNWIDLGVKSQSSSTRAG